MGQSDSLVRATFELGEAMGEYIVQSQIFDRCDPENFDNARKEILATLDEVIEQIRAFRRARRAVAVTGSPSEHQQESER